jgi:methylglutaconyl-CoA hydratase
MSNAAQTLECTVHGGIAQLWLARPEQRNALDETLMAELTATIRGLGERTDVRVIVLGGRGKAFCAGADLNWMARAARYTREQNLEDVSRLSTLLQALDHVSKPTIARVHGACYAGATGLVAACDLAIAADDARFCFSEVRLGLVPATISPYVQRAMGYRASLQHMLAADVFDAATALRTGLVNEIVPVDKLDSRIDALAQALRHAGPRALAETKRLLRHIHGRPIDADTIDKTIECIADARVSTEGVEGVRALLAGEKPRWSGE